MHRPPFLSAFRGSFKSTLRWPQLEHLWEALRRDAGGDWYIYAVGEAPPAAPADAEQVSRFIEQIDKLIREEHDESFCGIVYADDLDRPSFVKIYDPNNLGMVCGYSEHPPLPGWVMSKLQPVDLQAALPPPGNRRQWWRRLFGS